MFPTVNPLSILVGGLLRMTGNLAILSTFSQIPKSEEYRRTVPSVTLNANSPSDPRSRSESDKLSKNLVIFLSVMKFKIPPN